MHERPALAQLGAAHRRHLRPLGNGKTAIKASWGSYLDQINTGTPPNPNANINQSYVWNDLNGDLSSSRATATWNGPKYVGGEFGALQTTIDLAVAVFDKYAPPPVSQRVDPSASITSCSRTCSDVSYLRTREKDIQGTIDNNIDLWPSLYTPITLTDPGRDGVSAPATTRRSRSTTRTPASRPRPRRSTTIGWPPATTASTSSSPSASSQGWTLLAGYTYSHTKWI